MNEVFVFAIVLLVGLNMCAILGANYKEWFEEFREYNVCEFALLLTLLLPTTILFALIYVLSIKPFNRKEINR